MEISNFRGINCRVPHYEAKALYGNSIAQKAASLWKAESEWASNDMGDQLLGKLNKELQYGHEKGGPLASAS